MKEKKIPILFTKDQYKDLLLLVNIGNWVINSYSDDDSESEFTKMESFIASHHTEFGENKLAEFDTDLNGYFPTQELEEWAQKFIEPYENDVFWEKLAERFVVRDLRRQFDPAQIKKMSREIFFEKYDRLISQYQSEFENHGLQRLFVRNENGDLIEADVGSLPAKVGRNEPCPCGSGKKYKKCCGGSPSANLAIKPDIPPPRLTERINANIHRLLSQKEFDSPEEMNAFLQKTLQENKGDVPEVTPQSALERAQELVYDAWESGSAVERVRLAKRAIEISPDCADAYNILAEDTNPSLDQATDLYQKGVEAGERALGKKMFEKEVGHFWGILETRPYMRAKSGLAGCLWLQDKGDSPKHDEAIKHYQELLRLNPNDNQGIRYILSAHLLELSKFEELGQLFQAYPNDGAAAWVYAQALYSFFKEGADSVDSKQLLREAINTNKYVPNYLLQFKKLPKKLPEYIGMGDEREAQACAHALMTSWQKNKGALEWLKASL